MFLVSITFFTINFTLKTYKNMTEEIVDIDLILETFEILMSEVYHNCILLPFSYS